MGECEQRNLLVLLLILDCDLEWESKIFSINHYRSIAIHIQLL